MYFQDKQRALDSSMIRQTQQASRYPLCKNRQGHYKIASGELLRVCMTSDFFLEEADAWRDAAWQTMRIRSDVRFFLLTKRPERVASTLPTNWGDGWENIFFNITCENQECADKRLPLLLQLPFKHKGVMVAPMLGPVNLADALATGQIEQVIAGGENYDGARPCDFKWIQSLSTQCREAGVRFCFIETGSHFVKEGHHYHLPDKKIQSRMAYKAGVNVEGRAIRFKLLDPVGRPIPPERLYKPLFRPSCQECGSRMICNGCSNCGKCKS
jgi:hypothetical protein